MDFHSDSLGHIRNRKTHSSIDQRRLSDMRVIHMLIACVTAASASNNGYLEKLLKRQEPGTPQYDCHAACGELHEDFALNRVLVLTCVQVASFAPRGCRASATPILSKPILTAA